ncbi:MAG: hypothetical protein ACYCPP_02830 [Nitrososphaerales archaeon]
MQKEDQFTLSISSESLDSVEINLRSSCLACKYVSFCPVVDESASPDKDTLIGSYNFKALKTRCLQ